MSKITASVICDSIGEHSPRLTTFLTHYPKFVHAEMCRHRAFSLCVSSSRAIPSKRYLEIVRSDEERAEPAFWGAEQKGMSPGAELPEFEKACAQRAWEGAAEMAAVHAEIMQDITPGWSAHKSIRNRLLDPFVPVNVLVTSCEAGLLNWFGLRLDKSADPTIRALAEAMWVAWNESVPQALDSGAWHLPFVGSKEEAEAGWAQIACAALLKDVDGWNELEVLKRISTARCARLSYMSYDTGKRSTIEEDLALYDRLITAKPIHASPAEHQATPDKPRLWNSDILGWSEEETFGLPFWQHPELHGNLPGWVQHRRLLPNQEIALLPEGYVYNRPQL